jgi:alpha-tubulin suppressor-like RCC1 family protein
MAASFATIAQKLTIVGLAVFMTLTTIVACNAILGVEDVKLKKGKDGAIEEEEDTGSLPPEEDGTPIVTRPNLFQAALGDLHSCARKPDLTVRCWGDDTQGQLGAGLTSDGGLIPNPVDVPGIDDAVDIASGKNHTCVARKDGKVSCWGYNLDGQLGNGESSNRHSTPVDVKGLTGAVAVAAGGNFSCAARGGGSVACWGGNGNGQLGKGDEAPALTPAVVLDLTGVIAISAGQAHACAVKSDGSVACWGDGLNGQLGQGTPKSSSKPVSVASLPEAVQVAAGERSTCALTRTGSVLCWGANEVGQLGSGATNANANASPTNVSNLSDATAIWSGRNHTCAVRKGGAVVCWGSGSRGQLGDGQPRTDGGGPQPSFVPVSGIQTATNVGSGGDHSCAPTKTNAIVCWGANDRGQLGNGTTKSELSPVSVTGYP